jgi:hypothetical protein
MRKTRVGLRDCRQSGRATERGFGVEEGRLQRVVADWAGVRITSNPARGEQARQDEKQSPERRGRADSRAGHGDPSVARDPAGPPLINPVQVAPSRRTPNRRMMPAQEVPAFALMPSPGRSLPRMRVFAA